MKTKKYFLLIVVIVLLSSCKNETDEYYTLATPVMVSLADVRESIDILPPTDIISSGKIYSYNDYIFVNDSNRGIHIIDNSNPQNPSKISFLNIPGNSDISVKDNKLYANSFVDLIVFDISDINSIIKVNILKDVFYYYWDIPTDVDAVDWNSVEYDKFAVDWIVTTEKGPIENNYIYTLDSMFNGSVEANIASNVGTGG